MSYQENYIRSRMPSFNGSTFWIGVTDDIHEGNWTDVWNNPLLYTGEMAFIYSSFN